MTTLIIQNKDMDDIMKIVKSLKESDLFIKFVSEPFKKQGKVKKVYFLKCYQSQLGAGLLRDLLTDEGVAKSNERFI